MFQKLYWNECFSSMARNLVTTEFDLLQEQFNALLMTSIACWSLFRQKEHELKHCGKHCAKVWSLKVRDPEESRRVFVISIELRACSRVCLGAVEWRSRWANHTALPMWDCGRECLGSEACGEDTMVRPLHRTIINLKWEKHNQPQQD